MAPHHMQHRFVNIFEANHFNMCSLVFVCSLQLKKWIPSQLLWLYWFNIENITQNTLIATRGLWIQNTGVLRNTGLGSLAPPAQHPLPHLNKLSRRSWSIHGGGKEPDLQHNVKQQHKQLITRQKWKNQQMTMAETMVIRRNDDSRVRNHEIAETNQSCMCH
jgi:hypothetical protein